MTESFSAESFTTESFTATHALLAAIALMNLGGFVAMGIDKRRAVLKRTRIRERTLLLCAALTGAVGSWLGMFCFRHKTRKPSFIFKIVLASAVNGLWWYLYQRL